MRKYIGLLPIIVIVLGYWSPLISDNFYVYGEHNYRNLFEKAGIRFTSIFTLITLSALLLAHVNWTKTAITVVSLQLLFLLSWLVYTVKSYVDATKSGEFSHFIDRGDFSFLGFGWYLIIFGFVSLLIALPWSRKGP